MAYYLAEAAMSALHEFLTDATDGLNIEIESKRVAEGITPAELPDVASFEKWRHSAKNAQSYPYMSLVCVSADPQSAPRSRFNELRFELTIVVLDKMVGSSEVNAIQAVWRYYDALQKLFYRIQIGRNGSNLNGGGTAAAGRVNRATLGPARMGADGEMAGRTNKLLNVDLTIRMTEDY